MAAFSPTPCRPAVRLLSPLAGGSPDPREVAPLVVRPQLCDERGTFTLVQSVSSMRRNAAKLTPLFHFFWWDPDGSGMATLCHKVMSI